MAGPVPPARRVLPRTAAVSDALGMDLSRFPAPARVAVNLAYLAGCYLLVSPLLP